MVKIDQEKCIGCGKCAADCIGLNIEIKEKKAFVKKECFLCGHCVAICPANAVSIPEYGMEEVEEYEKGRFCLDPGQVLRSIKYRRSIRSYKGQKVHKDDLKLLAQAGRYTATAKNSQGTGFIFVQDEMEQLKRMVWNYIDETEKEQGQNVAEDIRPYLSFNRRRKLNPEDDYLFRNAPVVLFLTSERILDTGMAAQNIEMLAVSMGLGAMYNGYLARIADADMELKKWLGIEEKTIRACMLLGYPDRHYARTAPRKQLDVIWK